jgi:predicted ribosome-associated RNA-binding protein Tma20
LAAAYGLSQKQLEEYKDKVAEKLGIKKQQDIQDSLAQDRVNNTPGSTQILVVEGEVLCFDQPTGRYFRSTMEGINRAVNATNAEITRHGYADANFFPRHGRPKSVGIPRPSWT